MSGSGSSSTYFYSGPLGSPMAPARSGSASGRGASASASSGAPGGPLLPHMQPPSLAALHEQQAAQAQAQQAQIDSARGNKRPTKLAGLGSVAAAQPPAALQLAQLIALSACRLGRSPSTHPAAFSVLLSTLLPQ